MAKKYVALTYDEARHLALENLPNIVLDEMTPGEIVTYAETITLHRRIDEIENQAADMMSPDKMMELATSFLGAPGALG